MDSQKALLVRKMEPLFENREKSEIRNPKSEIREAHPRRKGEVWDSRPVAQDLPAGPFGHFMGPGAVPLIAPARSAELFAGVGRHRWRRRSYHCRPVHAGGYTGTTGCRSCYERAVALGGRLPPRAQPSAR